QLLPFKGIDVLLEAMQLLERDFRGHLWVHGANLDLQPQEFRDRVDTLLEETRANVTFAGAYAPSEVGELMAAVDWVVVPSIWWENSPLVIEEAFLHGRPVICSNVGGMAEKVAHGVNGLHFRVRDPVSLAAAIEHAVSTPGLWRTLRDAIP